MDAWQAIREIRQIRFSFEQILIQLKVPDNMISNYCYPESQRDCEELLAGLKKTSSVYIALLEDYERTIYALIHGIFFNDADYADQIRSKYIYTTESTMNNGITKLIMSPDEAREILDKEARIVFEIENLLNQAKTIVNKVDHEWISDTQSAFNEAFLNMERNIYSYINGLYAHNDQLRNLV